jgi:hypothetical protein
MVERARALADLHGVAMRAAVCAREELPERGGDARFDAVFCGGNSLAHPPGRAGRRALVIYAWAIPDA